jgi:putative tricarboxylic transport membrane protein
MIFPRWDFSEGGSMTKERVSSLIFLIAGIYGLFFSFQLPMGKWSEPGPGVFPLCISALLVLSGVIWFVLDKSKRGDKAIIGVQEILENMKSPLKIVGLTAVFILILQQVGYLLASILYMFFLFFWVSRYKLLTALGLALLLAVGSWYFFGRLLSVPLPEGLLPL